MWSWKGKKCQHVNNVENKHPHNNFFPPGSISSYYSEEIPGKNVYSSIKHGGATEKSEVKSKRCVTDLNSKQKHGPVWTDVRFPARSATPTRSWHTQGLLNFMSRLKKIKYLRVQQDTLCSMFSALWSSIESFVLMCMEQIISHSSLW